MVKEEYRILVNERFMPCLQLVLCMAQSAMQGTPTIHAHHIWRG